MSEKKRPIKSDLKRIDALSDQQIDYSDIPEIDDDFIKNATMVVFPRPKDSITLRVDHDVLSWFKKKGRGYQTRMNAVLKSYVKAHQDREVIAS